MSQYTDDDFLECEDIETKAHICLHRIKDYEMKVQIPMLANDEIPISYLEYVNFASQEMAAGFDVRYTTVIESGDGEPIQATCGPMVLMGIYESFLMLLAGHQFNAVPTDVMASFGQFMVASARPFFYMLKGCDL